MMIYVFYEYPSIAPNMSYGAFLKPISGFLGSALVPVFGVAGRLLRCIHKKFMNLLPFEYSDFCQNDRQKVMLKF